MPIYDVHHSYPLTQPQKQKLAETITRLHSTAFLTPSLFVHVKFHSQEASDNTYFLAGKPRVTATNRIQGMVRQGPSRSKEDFDKLAEALENAWYDVVSGQVIEEEGKDQGKRENALADTDSVTQAKKLAIVAFYGMVDARENGHVIPAAGEEAQWFKEHKEEFQRRADAGDELYQGLLQEVEEREDLKKAYGA